MYPFLKFISVLLKAGQKPASHITDQGHIAMRAMPWDMDMFAELNNGRILTFYDLGRFDFAVTSGLMKVLKRKKWGLAVAGGTVRYRKRVTVFNKIDMATQFIGCDEKWFYIYQHMSVKGQPTSSALFRTCVTGNRRAVPIAEVMQELGVTETDLPTLPDWAQSWIDADQDHPWPPQ